MQKEIEEKRRVREVDEREPEVIENIHGGKIIIDPNAEVDDQNVESSPKK